VYFSLVAYRCTFEALEAVSFAPGTAGNAFRGAFGALFRRVAGAPVYASFFEPSSASGPSGLANAPRPFVIRAAALEGREIPAGGQFSIDVHVFDLKEPALQYLVAAFTQLAREGIGSRRARVLLRGVHTVDRERNPDACVYQDERLQEGRPEPLVLPLAPDAGPVSQVAVRFLTPTELKGAGGIVPEPAFGILFARVRDRISTLRRLYGEGALEIDFRSMAARAGRVRMTASRLEWESYRRRSSRTGQVHPLGGFTGEAWYEGDLAEFTPFLRAAYWTGVGRQTVWGKGAISITTGKLVQEDVKGHYGSDSGAFGT